MTDNVDIVNRALQAMGTRTTVTASELANETTNEAIQANLVLTTIRDNLLRMAPWNCALKTANLAYITSAPGTTENPTEGAAVWDRGIPSPPWLYEYQYPVDCLRACWIIPGWNSAGSGTPIFPVTTGMSPNLYSGPPIRFKVQIDEFYPVTAAAVAAGGSGYAVGDIITLAETPDGDDPIGAPVQLVVATLAGSAVATVIVVNQILGSADPLGGSYFEPQTNPVAQSSTTGSGTGATFNLTFGPKGKQRVILTNQQQAILVYCAQVTDPNVMDSMFEDAWVNVLGATLAMVITGDKALANGLIQQANMSIVEARNADGNEGLTVNDVTPDWIRVRGWPGADGYGTAFAQFEWGGLWPTF